MKRDFRYIYGPVWSWRLRRSLGIDPLSGKDKVCSFDCVYCQIGKTNIFRRCPKVFVPTKKIIEEIKSLPKMNIDYITFSGRGEPTLAKNLKSLIKAVKKVRKEKIAVLTNSSLLLDKQVRHALMLADLVALKLDAHSQESFDRINKPTKGIRFKDVIKGIKLFRKEYKGKLALQIMFTRQSKHGVKKIALLTKEIKPDEVQINTPLRSSKTKPLSKREIANIRKYFQGLNVVAVYDRERKVISALNKKRVLERRRKV